MPGECGHARAVMRCQRTISSCSIKELAEVTGRLSGSRAALCLSALACAQHACAMPGRVR